jgi:addiction module HigA family antidote
VQRPPRGFLGPVPLPVQLFNRSVRQRKIKLALYRIRSMAPLLRSDSTRTEGREILREEYMIPLALSSNALARALNVAAARTNEIVRERRGISADIALRLARYFKTDVQSWLNLQANYDLP